MTLDKFSILLVLCSMVSYTTGCNCLDGQCSLPKPFTQTAKTVAPPATFSSQESYLGQMPGNYVPKTPATTFPTTTPPSASPIPAMQPATIPASTTLSNTAESTSDWSSAEVLATNQTAFQAMESKLNSDGVGNALTAYTSEAPIVGSSYVATTILDE